MTLLTRLSATRRSRLSAILPWNDADRASAPGAPRNRATIVALPASYSSARRWLTVADSDVGSNQPPDDNALDALLASTREPAARMMARTKTILRKR